MNSLLYYYNNVQKMAAYRQAKRMQRGVLTAAGRILDNGSSLAADAVYYSVRVCCKGIQK